MVVGWVETERTAPSKVDTRSPGSFLMGAALLLMRWRARKAWLGCWRLVPCASSCEKTRGWEGAATSGVASHDWREAGLPSDAWDALVRGASGDGADNGLGQKDS